MISKTQQEFLFGMLIGATIGASTAFFLAPFSGSELRRQMLNGVAYSTSTKPKRKAVSKRKPRKIAPAKRDVVQTGAKKSRNKVKKASTSPSKAHGSTQH